jgi:hypothetical protein
MAGVEPGDGADDQGGGDAADRDLAGTSVGRCLLWAQPVVTAIRGDAAGDAAGGGERADFGEGRGRWHWWHEGTAEPDLDRLSRAELTVVSARPLRSRWRG